MSSVSAQSGSIGVTTRSADTGSRIAGRFITGLLVVQLIVGFEFFWTVTAKLVRGGFVSGLAGDLKDRVTAAPGWYRSFADSVVIPHASLFGYLIIAGELFVGIVLIAGAIVWLARWDRLSTGGRSALVMAIILAAAAGLAMNLNYHVANGATNPWQIGETFDEAVDINTVLALTEATIIVVMAGVLTRLRRSGGRTS